MHILFAHNDYAKFSGEENAVRVMTEALESRGHKISWYRRSSEDIGGSVVKKTQAFFSGIYSFKSRKRIAQILDEGEYDLVQVQNLYPLISASILPACRERNIPIVMRCPNYRLFCPNGLHLSHGKICERCLGGKEWNCVLQNCEENLPKSIGYAARNAFARITGMITDNVSHYMVLSQFVKQRFEDGGISPDKVSVLPNVAPEVQLDENMPIGDSITYVGRVSAEKGIYDFLEAARKLSHLKFAIAGSASTMPGIENEAPDNVRFTGFLSGQDLDNFYRNSRVLVFPTVWYEACPNALMQAMAYGKPAIASRLGVMPDILDDNVTGLLFEPGNALDLADKIERLWNDTALCREMGDAGLLKARQEYSEQRLYERLMHAYKTATKTI